MKKKCNLQSSNSAHAADSDSSFDLDDPVSFNPDDQSPTLVAASIAAAKNARADLFAATISSPHPMNALSKAAAVAAATAGSLNDPKLQAAAAIARSISDNPAIRLAQLTSKWTMDNPALRLADQVSKMMSHSPAFESARLIHQATDISPALKLAKLMATEYHGSSLAKAAIQATHDMPALRLASLADSVLGNRTALKVATLGSSLFADSSILRAAAQTARAINDDWGGLKKAFATDIFNDTVGFQKAAAATRALEQLDKWKLASAAVKAWNDRESPLLTYLSSNDAVDLSVFAHTAQAEQTGTIANEDLTPLLVNPELETEIVSQLKSGCTAQELPASAKSHLMLYLSYLYKLIMFILVLVEIWQAIDFLNAKLAAVEKPADVKEVIAKLPLEQKRLLAGHRVVNAHRVILRARSLSGSDALARLGLGNVLEVLEDSEAWVKVSVDVAGESREGWVYRRYTSPIQTATQRYVTKSE
jgi:hypothetical protein